MKMLKNTFLIVLMSVGFAYGQEIVVQGEKKLNADFKKYKTYDWMDANKPHPQLIEYTYEEIIIPTDAEINSEKNRKSSKNNKSKKEQSNNKEVIVYSYYFVLPSEDPTVNTTLTNAVEDEMGGRGYKQNPTNPDLLISYKIFDHTTKIKGYAEDAPQLNHVGTEVRPSKDTVTYALKPGTILITLIDAKTSNVVWEGFASGIVQDYDIFNDKTKIKEAINLIYKKYEWRADKYSSLN